MKKEKLIPLKLGRPFGGDKYKITQLKKGEHIKLFPEDKGKVRQAMQYHSRQTGMEFRFYLLENGQLICRREK